MMDYYLNTTDEAAMTTALAEAGVTDSEGNLLPDRHLSVIGTWYTQTGGTPEEPIFTAEPGWHFNVRSNVEITWPAEVNITAPLTPWRIWG